MLSLVGAGEVKAEVSPNNHTMESLLSMSLDELVTVEVSLATGTAKPLQLAPAVASVITTEEIAAMGATNLAEVLETVPGLHVVPSNYNRLTPLYTIRGIYTNQNPQVLVMLDGTPIKNVSNGIRPANFNISVANISRIEIIRGPGSAMHGADAFAGTINIITKNATEIAGSRASMQVDSSGTTDTAMQYGGTHLGWRTAVNLDFMRSDGADDRAIDADLQTSLDSAFGTSASVAPGPLDTDYRIWDGHLSLEKDNWTMRLWGWQLEDGGEGTGAAQALDPKGRENRDIFFTDLIYRSNQLAPNWDLDLRLGYKYFKGDSFLHVFPAGAVLPIGADGNIDFINTVGLTAFPDGLIGNPTSKEHHSDLAVTALYKGLTDHLIRIGAGFSFLAFEASETKNFGPGILDGTQVSQDGTLTDVTGTQYIYIDNHHRKISYLALQDEWTLAKQWELTAGARYDHYSDFGDTVNPRLALVWKTRDDLTTKLLYGRAFRPPSFTESFFKNNPLTIGNPELEPETIDTVELAWAYKPAKTFNSTFNVFAYKIDGLIEVVQDSGQPTKTAQNATDQEGHGFELEANWLVSESLRLRANLAYQRSRDKDSQAIVPYAPELEFYGNAHWIFRPKWSLDSQYFWIAGRHRAAGDTRADIKNNDIVNLTLRRKDIAQQWGLVLAVRNLFDEDVREPSQPSIPGDFPMEGRTGWMEVAYHY